MDFTDNIESFSFVNVYSDCFNNSVAFLQNPGGRTDVAASRGTAPPNTTPGALRSSQRPPPVTKGHKAPHPEGGEAERGASE